MAKNRQHDPLARLVRQGDDAVRSVSALLRETFAIVADRVERCRKTLNLAGSASDRERVFNTVRQEMRRASAKIDVILQAQRKRAAKAAAKAAEDMTGLQVKYSEKRAKAICELVTPAQGENLAAVFTDKMGEHYINTLREATVQVIREQAVAGGSMKDASRELLERWKERSRDASPKFVDVSGRTWDTGAYLQMNVRTNSMRVYNDCLVDNVARTTGSDIMRISDGGDPGCHCAAWEGVIVSISGKTKEFPSYAEARAAGVFHPNCTHTLEYIDEDADAEEIAAQKKHPYNHENGGEHAAAHERKYRIDQERYRMKGLGAKAARVAVDRDNIDAAIRNGLGKDIREEVDRLTDAQVERLVKNGHPPKFEPLKLTKRERSKMKPADIEKLERWNHGSAGGVVHIDREGLTAEKLVKVCKVEDAGTVERKTKDFLEAERKAVLDLAHKVFTEYESDTEKVLNFGRVNNKAAERIKRFTGVSAHGQPYTITENRLKHIRRVHCAPIELPSGRVVGSRQKRKYWLSEDELQTVTSILENPDFIAKSGHKSSTGEPSVLYVKNMEDHSLIVAVGAWSLSVKTMYKKNKNVEPPPVDML